ncbi:MAG: hypothetical protein CVU38_06225 [Chloroflexi bacterium HGW-Chloroflexi-1]|nr:MAG: hypothetical protein CVU38_06225 [Chloroflexi bacterium HGW-Chloroflexi-1]
MSNAKLRNFVIVLALAAMTLGLGGCRKKETTAIPTPAGQNAPSQQSLPLVGGENSPLPTPNTATSPVTP